MKVRSTQQHPRAAMLSRLAVRAARRAAEADPLYGLEGVLPSGVVTHPSTTDPILYSTPQRNVGDSHGKMRARGWYGSGPRTEDLSDAGTGAYRLGTITGVPMLARSVVDQWGEPWRLDAIGTGTHHRGCAAAHSLTVNGVPMSSRPVKLKTWRRWARILDVMAGRTLPTVEPASLWAGMAAFASHSAPVPFTPRAASGEVIIGATQRPRSTETRAPGTRRRRTDAEIISAASVLLHRYVNDGIPAPRPGRPSEPERLARIALVSVAEGITPQTNLAHILRDAMRRTRTTATT